MNLVGSIPYVPGSGYGFSRPAFAILAAEIAGESGAPPTPPNAARVTPPGAGEALRNEPRQAPGGDAQAPVIDFSGLGRIFAKVRELLAPSDLPLDESGVGPFGLTPEERLELAELRRIDAAVRQGEKIQTVREGDSAEPPTYVYQVGPDGNLYAVAGGAGLAIRPGIGDPQALRHVLGAGEPASPVAPDPGAMRESATGHAPALDQPAPDDPAAYDPRRRDAATGRLVDIFG